MRESWPLWGKHLAVLGLFAGLTLVVTYPLPLQMSQVGSVNRWSIWASCGRSRFAILHIGRDSALG